MITYLIMTESSSIPTMIAAILAEIGTVVTVIVAAIYKIKLILQKRTGDAEIELEKLKRKRAETLADLSVLLDPDVSHEVKKLHKERIKMREGI